MLCCQLSHQQTIFALLQSIAEDLEVVSTTTIPKDVLEGGAMEEAAQMEHTHISIHARPRITPHNLLLLDHHPMISAVVASLV